MSRHRILHLHRVQYDGQRIYFESRDPAYSFICSYMQILILGTLAYFGLALCAMCIDCAQLRGFYEKFAYNEVQAKINREICSDMKKKKINKIVAPSDLYFDPLWRRGGWGVNEVNLQFGTGGD